MYLNLVFWAKPSLSFLIRCSKTDIIKSILESKKKKKKKGNRDFSKSNVRAKRYFIFNGHIPFG